MKNNYKNNDIIHTQNIHDDLSKILENYNEEKIVILTDDICRSLCYPKVENLFNNNIYLFEIQHGEHYKSLKTVKKIWDFLIEKNFNRNSLMINLGGGVITDIGGFAASTFKRGINFINIPTTLLAQIDASVGGKTGINYGELKNEIGMFSLPTKVILSHTFLKTLDRREFFSGYAEMIKHALIKDHSHLTELINFYKTDYKNLDFSKLQNLIKKSVLIKDHFIRNDLLDKGQRKILNFGHTFGHAFESYFNKSNKQIIKHGEAVAIGMICELFISTLNFKMERNTFEEVKQFILSIYNNFQIPVNDFELIYNLMLHDKKNDKKGINCILFKAIETPIYNKTISKDQIFKTLNYLNNLTK